jgi:phosphomevalonate kinase
VTGRGTVRRHAPGKLFIAGEYAVIEPGHPAILIAVDRRVTVAVSASGGAEVTIDSDLYPGGPAAPAHVLSAVSVVDELLTARDMRIPPVHIAVTSSLHRNGTKFGLGSSGAVTVATVTAVAAYAGLGLSPEERFRLAMLATARLDPRASGGDLAASVWGGWIAYRAPDRAAVLDLAQRRGIEETLRAPWPGFEVRWLPPPLGLALEVGWTGEPASTASLAGRLDAGEWPGSASHHSFLKRSDECVLAAIRALERGANRELTEQVRGARQVLAELDDEVGLGIFTPRLTALCDAAEALGGAAKPSGAGGGDCGIALLEAAAGGEISQLRKEWAAVGVLPLPIRVEPRNGSEQ